MQGIVEFFNIEKGFGIVLSEDNNEKCFIHITQCPVVGVNQFGRKNYRIPREGETISFELIKNDIGKAEAANIAFIEHSNDDMTDDGEI